MWHRKKRKNKEKEKRNFHSLAIVWYSATTNDPTSSSLARLAGLGLAYLLALLTGYIIQYSISQSARLLFFLFNSICFCNWPDWPGITN